MVYSLDLSVFSKRLKEARTEKKMSQKELSALAGVSTVMISSYERSDEKGGNPSLANAVAIASALGVSLDWLCGRSEQQSDTNNESETTELFLNSIVKLLNAVKCEQDTRIDNRGNDQSIFSISVYDGSYLYSFIHDYIDVMPAFYHLTPPLQKVVVERVIANYLEHSIDDILKDGKAFEDELPF